MVLKPSAFPGTGSVLRLLSRLGPLRALIRVGGSRPVVVGQPRGASCQEVPSLGIPKPLLCVCTLECEVMGSETQDHFLFPAQNSTQCPESFNAWSTVLGAVGGDYT